MLNNCLLSLLALTANFFFGSHSFAEATQQHETATAPQTSGYCYVANNRDYAPAVRKVFQNAKASISLLLYQARFYEEHPDSVTNAFVEDLIAAAQRGVQVRIVADTGDWNPQGGAKNTYLLEFIDRLTTSGAMLWEDSPKTVSHEKVILVDDNISVVSSHNWSYYSTDLNNEVAVAVDDKKLNATLREYFAQCAKEGKPYKNVPDTDAALDYAPQAGASLESLGIQGEKQPLSGDVLCLDNRAFYDELLRQIHGAKSEIHVVQRSLNLYDKRPSFAGTTMPAMLPGEPASPTNVLADALIDAQQRNIKTTIVLDKSSDAEGQGNETTARFFTDRGVTVLADDASTQTHAKMLIFDNDKVIVGSTNWTWPAFETGNEVSVLLSGESLNKAYKDFVNTEITSGTAFLGTSTTVWKPIQASAPRR